MKVWMVERHWDLDVNIMGIYSTKEKAIKMAETEKIKDFHWRSFDESKIDMLCPYYVSDFSIYVIEMEVHLFFEKPIDKLL